MHLRRTILCLATIFFWAAHDPDMASGQSSELMDAYNSYNALSQQGRYSEAETYAKEALRLGIEEFGPNDPTTATLLNNLALLYKVQGHYADAEPLYQRSLAIREKALGPEHPDVATSINNLALLYQAQGRYAEAESLFRRSLAIREKVFGTVAELVATTESAKLEAGVFFQAHIIKPPNLPPHKVWIYHPDPLPSNRMPLVVIPPAGGRFFSAPDLVLGDRPEHLPYVRAGFAVVSFNMQGAAPSDASNSELLMAASAFRAGQAGIENARSALGFVLSRLSIDPSRIYAAGHSSAATLVLLFAAMDPRIRGVAAYAPAVDVTAHLGSNLVQTLESALPGYERFLNWSSPATHISKLSIPIFLFHAKDDGNISYQGTLKFAEALRQANQLIRFVSAERGGHYESMIETGIPAGLNWMISLANL